VEVRFLSTAPILPAKMDTPQRAPLGVRAKAFYSQQDL